MSIYKVTLKSVHGVSTFIYNEGLKNFSDFKGASFNFDKADEKFVKYLVNKSIYKIRWKFTNGSLYKLTIEKVN